MLHLTLRDAVPGLAVLYYALPRGILILLAATAALASLAQGSRRAALSWTVIAVGIACWWHSAEWIDASPPTSEAGVRVMYWNVARGISGWDAVIARIEHEQPDLVALGETAYPTGEFRAMWRERLPQYDISFLGAGMVCLVRGTSTRSEIPRISKYSQVRQIDVAIDGSELRCLIVDVYAHPLYDRRTVLAEIARIADESSGRPMLVLGDFNTPVDSVHFHDLRRSLVNTFEHAGSGYIATWPAFAPILSLDQIWANRHVEIVNCRHGRTSVSDHRPVLMTFRIPAKTPTVPADGN